MVRWRCPLCDRQFGARGQSHVCARGITVQQLLARHPSWVTEIYSRIIGELKACGPLHEDAVDVGIFLKSDRKIGEFRPRVRSAQLTLFLPDQRDHPLIGTVQSVSVDRFMHPLKLTQADQVDDTIAGWLDESYDFNTD